MNQTDSADNYWDKCLCRHDTIQELEPGTANKALVMYHKAIKYTYPRQIGALFHQFKFSKQRDMTSQRDNKT